MVEEGGTPLEKPPSVSVFLVDEVHCPVVAGHIEALVGGQGRCSDRGGMAGEVVPGGEQGGAGQEAPLFRAVVRLVGNQALAMGGDKEEAVVQGDHGGGGGGAGDALVFGDEASVREGESVEDVGAFHEDLAVVCQKGGAVEEEPGEEPEDLSGA